MATEPDDIQNLVNRRYKHGFVTDIETESLPPGLDEDVVRAISARKNEPEWMLEWRLQAYQQWLEMTEPEWAHVHYPKIEYNEISYFAAPKSDEDRPKSLDEVEIDIEALGMDAPAEPAETDDQASANYEAYAAVAVVVGFLCGPHR